MNRAYYLRESPGRLDYWRRMAAPRFRISVFSALLQEQLVSTLIYLGCGNGELLNDIHERVPNMNLCGIDLSSMQIESNRRRYPTLQWSVMDLDEAHAFAPALAGRFDVVLASEIIEHVKNPDQFLKNARALAKPGTGRLFLSTQSGRVWETEKRVGHYRHFSRGDLEALLRGAGWEPLRVWNAGFPFHDVSKWWANRDPDASMNRFGNEAYGPLEKFICFALRVLFKFNSHRLGAQLFAVARHHQS